MLSCEQPMVTSNSSAHVERRLIFKFIPPAQIARAMNQTPVSCLPNARMSKAKRVLEEAREIKNPELDLADKGICTFEEMPGLCK